MSKKLTCKAYFLAWMYNLSFEWQKDERNLLRCRTTDEWSQSTLWNTKTIVNTFVYFISFILRKNTYNILTIIYYKTQKTALLHQLLYCCKLPNLSQKTNNKSYYFLILRSCAGLEILRSFYELNLHKYHSFWYNDL